MIAQITSEIHPIFTFVTIIGVIALLICFRIVSDYDKMKARAYGALLDLKNRVRQMQNNIATDNIGDFMQVVPITEEFESFIIKIAEQEASLAEKAKALTKKEKNVTLLTKINIGTGEWLRLAQQAETARESLDKYVDSYKLQWSLTKYDQPTNMEFID